MWLPPSKKPLASVNGRLALTLSTVALRSSARMMSWASSMVSTSSASSLWRWENMWALRKPWAHQSLLPCAAWWEACPGQLCKARPTCRPAPQCLLVMSVRVWPPQFSKPTSCWSSQKQMLMLVWLLRHLGRWATGDWSQPLMLRFAAELMAPLKVVTLCSWLQKGFWKLVKMFTISSIGGVSSYRGLQEVLWPQNHKLRVVPPMRQSLHVATSSTCSSPNWSLLSSCRWSHHCSPPWWQMPNLSTIRTTENRCHRWTSGLDLRSAWWRSSFRAWVDSCAGSPAKGSLQMAWRRCQHVRAWQIVFAMERWSSSTILPTLQPKRNHFQSDKRKSILHQNLCPLPRPRCQSSPRFLKRMLFLRTWRLLRMTSPLNPTSPMCMRTFLKRKRSLPRSATHRMRGW